MRGNQRTKKGTSPMKTKTTAKTKKSKVKMQDLKPEKDPKASKLSAGTHLASVTDLVIDPFNPNR